MMNSVQDKNNNNNNINILGIETSCDETSAAIVQNGRIVLSNIISSQIDTHKNFGGVIPEIAARMHLEVISQVIDQALEQANINKKDINAIAVTNGPGLVGALLVGVSYAKTLAYVLNKPLISVNHIAGHISANYLENDFKPPFICCVVSGGHTNLIYVRDYNLFEVLGQTRDDAAGEVYDKIARVLGLSYPGGPKIDNLAKSGDLSAIKFPQALLEENNFDFSFSGLKSSVINFIYKNKEVINNDQTKKNIAASFQFAVTQVILKKTLMACKLKSCKKIALAGGVAANSYLRKIFFNACQENNIIFNMPKNIFCTDNAAMIASNGYFKFINKKIAGLSLNAIPNLKLGE